MKASKVKVSADHLRFTPMSRNKKAALRRKNVIELIRSKPEGAPITLREFTKACGYRQTAAAHELLKTMLDRGTIIRQLVGINRFSYNVAADVVNDVMRYDITCARCFTTFTGRNKEAINEAFKAHEAVHNIRTGEQWLAKFLLTLGDYGINTSSKVEPIPTVIKAAKITAGLTEKEQLK